MPALRYQRALWAACALAIVLAAPAGLLPTAGARSQNGKAARATAAAPSGATAPAAAATAEQAIRTVLDDQVAAWNRGDLKGFMQGYWRSRQLTFYSGGGVTSGWGATLARYQQRYQSEGREMGKLDFGDLEIHALGAGAAWVGGRWHLKMSGGKDLGGLFTLILKKLPEGWRIVHDHTSSS